MYIFKRQSGFHLVGYWLAWPQLNSWLTIIANVLNFKNCRIPSLDHGGLYSMIRYNLRSLCKLGMKPCTGNCKFLSDIPKLLRPSVKPVYKWSLYTEKYLKIVPFLFFYLYIIELSLYINSTLHWILVFTICKEFLEKNSGFRVSFILPTFL